MRYLTMRNMEPEIEQLSQFLAEFNGESDRGAALVAASMLDERLQGIIGSFLLESGTTDNLLTGFNAPLGSFAARASAALSLGLIQKNEFDEITIIRKIRNVLGHSWEKISFESGVLADLCGQLPWLGPAEYEQGANLLERFNSAIAILLTDLLWRIRLVAAERIEARVWPNKSRED